jgi:alanyl-tRNA synthetase
MQKQLAAPGLPLREKRRAQAAVTELQARFKAWEKAQQKQGGTGVDPVEAASKLLADAPDLAHGKLVVGEIPGASDDQLRSAIDSLRKRAPSHAVMLASSADVKVTFIAAVSDDLIAKGLKAGDWVRETAKIAGGGGGRPQMAQAGGKDPSKVADALDTAKTFAQSSVR